jgi:hypothetical protein
VRPSADITARKPSFVPFRVGWYAPLTGRLTELVPPAMAIRPAESKAIPEP